MSAAPLDPRPSAALEWTEDGAPRSAQFGDVYFSREDGLAETRTVFLDGCGLPEAWAGRSRFVVGELGLGTGLNVLALIELWRRTGPQGGRLNVFSVEGFPMTAAEAARALEAWPELADLTAPFLAAWPDVWTPGFHRIDLPQWGVTLDVAVGDAAGALAQWSGRADAWFLDGFSPALNPGMWSDAVLDGIAARSAPGARVATFTVAGAVRRGLSGRGFLVEKKPGFGRKRERLEARLPDRDVPPDLPPRTVAVIGAGIAGAATARALADLGLTPVVIEAEAPAAGASGFPAGLVTPRLDAGDAGLAALFAQALTHARDLYAGLPGAILAEGVLQLEQAPRDAARFDRIADQPIWAPGRMRRLDAAAASALLGEPAPTGGLMMADAFTVAPPVAVAALLRGIEVRQARVGRLHPTPEGWRLMDPDGATILEAGAVVLAAGWGLAALAPDLPLRPVRGQADWTRGAPAPPVTPPVAPPVAAAWGGYLAPTSDGFLFGATHDRDQTTTEVRPDDSARNHATLAARLPGLAAQAGASVGEARAAIRATTPDRLPVCGAMTAHPGLYVVGGLGSRGHALSPLLGRHLAALIAGAPSPLTTAAAHRLSPDRFGTTLTRE
jgi:tRNA 5-methylaminomethyl-2-thiouridine biosynthesis bifunctional protein